MKAVIKSAERSGSGYPDRNTAVKGEDLVEDPVCHTYVPISTAFKGVIEGKEVYFCSRECYEKQIKRKYSQ
jgi:YHS domain-containing protein